MSTLWWDCSVGAAGDMLLASLLDAGAELEVVRDGLVSLGLRRDVLRTERTQRGAFAALRAVVDAPENHPPGDHHHHHHHHHRPWRDIQQQLQQAALPERAKQRALTAYGRLAEAEAALHGMPVDEVELHEVGATDALVDIVGTCLALECLDVDRIVATPLPLGTGAVQGAHGRIPLPAPATLAVLRGYAVVTSPWPGEWVTPTGATLVASLAEPGGVPPMVITHTGHGAGSRNPPQVANIARAVLGTESSARGDVVEELRCQVDDMPGEHVPALLEALLREGALDAWVQPITMKKGRPGLALTALVPPARADLVAEAMLRHSTTLGLRRQRVGRDTLERWFDEVQTPYGSVRIKVGGRAGSPWQAKPEHADVARCARRHDVPLAEVHAAALTAWRQR